MKKIIILFLILPLIFSAPLFPHPDATDSQSGHNNRNTGEYHFHKQPEQKPVTSLTPLQDKNDTKVDETLTEPDEENKEETVYVTELGEKYHRTSCRYLKKSKIPIDKKDAMARGYGACKICKP